MMMKISCYFTMNVYLYKININSNTDICLHTAASNIIYSSDEVIVSFISELRRLEK